ncbi:Alpha/Beta hydrolase protein, partial [Stachybotrys elegans]
STCSDVHIFLGKGNNEPYPGRQGKLVSAICNGLPSCDYEDIQMHNMLSDEYCGAVSEGTQHGYEQIVAYNKRCPNSKLVVTGFSQGAHVVGDIFGGGGGTFFQGCQTRATPNVPFNTPAGQAIAAIVTFGDVRHTANQPYNYLGGATKWGLFPRNSQQLANAIQYAGVWRDYCATEDPICAGGNVVDDHLNYFDLYSNEVADYVHQKL